MTNITLITASATLLFQNDPFTGSISLNTSGSINYTTAQNHLFNGTISSSNLIIKDNVSIGFGEITGYPLFVRRAYGAGGVGLNINNIDSTSGRDAIFTIVPDVSTERGGYAFNTHNGGLGDVMAMYIQPNGNIGMGITSSWNKLDVIGNVKATSFTGSFTGSLSGSTSFSQTSSYSNGLNISNNYTVSGLNIKSGSNSKCGSVTVTTGSGSINTSAYTTSSVMFFTLQTLISASNGIMPRVTTYNTSSVNIVTGPSDGSTYKWMIINFV